MRTICVYQEFLTDAHKTQIREAAEPLASRGSGVPQVVLLLLRRGGPLLQGPVPFRQSGLPAD